jgi:hypothetical protein
MSQDCLIHIFKNRFDEEYYDYLIKILTDVQSLCENAIGHPKPKAYTEGNFEKGIQIDFCGIAATTLLGIAIEDDRLSDKRAQIKEAFTSLLSSEMTKELNSKGIYIKVRFILSYIYSTFFSCLVMAESSLGRPYASSRFIDYNYNLDELTFDQLKDSSFGKRQTRTLTEIANVVDKNPFLVMVKPEKSDNTLQVRFSLLPLPLCLLIINNKAISDPYLYAQELTGQRVHDLFFHYPLLVFDQTVNEQQVYYSYMANHFDYIWNNDLTLHCRDTTEFDIHNNSQDLAVIRKPSELKWDQKERRIKDYLDKHEKPYDLETVKKWRQLQRKKIANYVIASKTENAKESQVETENSKRQNLEAEHANSSNIKIWIDNDYNYCFNLEDCNAHNFHFSSRTPEKVFLIFLHYAYASKKNKVPIMHIKHPRKLKIFSEIAPTLTNCTTLRINVYYILEYLFDNKNHHKLRIHPDNIHLQDDIFDKARILKYGNWSTESKNQVVLDKKSNIYPVLWYSDEDDNLFQ